MKKPSKTKLTVTQGKTPGSAAASADRNTKSPLMGLLGGKKDYKKQGAQTPGADMAADTQPGFGTTGMTGET